MKALGVAPLLLLAACGPSIPTGTVFTSGPDGFEAWFPKPPVYSLKPNEADRSKDRHKYEVAGKALVLAVFWFNAPDPEDPEERVDRVMDGFKQKGWTVVRREAIQRQGCPGAGFTLKTEDKTFLRQEILFAKGRTYLVSVESALEARLGSELVKKFFSSFKLLDRRE